MLRPSWLIFTGRGRRQRSRSFAQRGPLAVALVGAILSLPIVLSRRADQAGVARPVFYKQERVGKNGRTFVLTKFRSMRVDAEQEVRFGPAKATRARRAWVASFARFASMRFRSSGTS
jgi:lipopolysaccharide/colanic/teichoic acid biosynthesis glycosyltransferase